MILHSKPKWLKIVARLWKSSATIEADPYFCIPKRLFISLKWRVKIDILCCIMKHFNHFLTDCILYRINFSYFTTKSDSASNEVTASYCNLRVIFPSIATECLNISLCRVINYFDTKGFQKTQFLKKLRKCSQNLLMVRNEVSSNYGHLYIRAGFTSSILTLIHRWLLLESPNSVTPLAIKE